MKTFDLHIILRFLLLFAASLACFSLIAFALDTVELARAGERRGGGLLRSALAALQRQPMQVLRLLPLAVITGSCLTAHRFGSGSELAVARAAGLPLWRFILPICLTAAFLGLFSSLALQPVSVLLAEQARRALEPARDDGAVFMLTADREGATLLWTRQDAADGQVLLDVAVLRFDAESRYRDRIDAAGALLDGAALMLERAVVTDRSGRQSAIGEMLLPLLEQPRATARPHDAGGISFWDLAARRFADGLPTVLPVRGLLLWHGLLAMPVLLAGLAMAAGCLALRQSKRHGAAAAIAFGMALGFLLFFGTELALAFGAIGDLPPFVAAWLPPATVCVIGLTCLINIEGY